MEGGKNRIPLCLDESIPSIRYSVHGRRHIKIEPRHNKLFGPNKMGEEVSFARAAGRIALRGKSGVR